MATDIDQKSFKSEVEDADGLVLVDFWAAWCPPCRALSPMLEQIDEELGDKVKGIPTVKLFKDGEEVKTWVGLMPKNNYVDEINSQL